MFCNPQISCSRKARVTNRNVFISNKHNSE
jgi:hypothetical protein